MKKGGLIIFIFNGFTKKANEAVNEAINCANSLGSEVVLCEHILYALVTLPDSIAQKLLSVSNVDKDTVYNYIVGQYGKATVTALTPANFSVSTKKVLESSFLEAKNLGHSLVLSEHILLSLLLENSSGINSILKACNVTSNTLYLSCISHISSKYVTDIPVKSIKKCEIPFCTDLTEFARLEKLDPCIGREDELKRVIQILSRRTKNNPCLIGEPGVGKTAVVEGLAQLIISGQAPCNLSDKRIFSLDISSMLAGTKYRGDFEERVKKVVEQVIALKNVILFVDELHNIIGTGSAEGSIDAANILKPQLARGELQLIGATTFDEYRRYIEKDAALERRFQPVTVEEPTIKQSIDILAGLKEKYELYHRLLITNEAIKAAVLLSALNVKDRFLPDKAIDLIDEASSMVRIQGGTIVLESHIAIVVSQMIGVPITDITGNESEKLLHLEERLKQHIVGQDKAIKAIVGAIRRGRMGVKDVKRPLGSFLLLGSTGVGKTELCKVLSKVMYKSDLKLRFDMSEYMEKHSISRLIGSPPGYIGYDNGGLLTEQIRKNPYSIVLFDEIEKAHPDVANILLQILEDGMLTDSKGRKCSFRNAIIIMTSNIGAKTLSFQKSYGFTPIVTTNDSTINNELKQYFSLELLNRIDEQIIFESLTKDDLSIIAQQQLNQLVKRLSSKFILTFSDEVALKLASISYDKQYGARPLRRAIVTNIEDMLAIKLLNGEIMEGDMVHIAVQDDEFIVSHKLSLVLQ